MMRRLVVLRDIIAIPLDDEYLPNGGTRIAQTPHSRILQWLSFERPRLRFNEPCL
jgi:hypothetical protein